MWSGVPEGATIEQRVDAAERNLIRMREDLTAYRKASNEQGRKHEDEMKRERAEREAADVAIQEKIKETETGGLKLERGRGLVAGVGDDMFDVPSRDGEQRGMGTRLVGLGCLILLRWRRIQVLSINEVGLRVARAEGSSNS